MEEKKHKQYAPVYRNVCKTKQNNEEIKNESNF